MNIEISKVVNRKDIKEFIRLPYNVYWGHRIRYSNWVPPLNMDLRQVLNKKNPMYDHTEGQFWLARENGEVLGRIAAFIDQNYVEYQKTQTGFFGYYECLDRSDVSEALFKTAEEWLRSRGMEKVMGPVNGSTNFQIGNQINNFEELPVIDMPYSAPYYGQQIENVGYSRAQDLYSYRRNVRDSPVSDRIRRISELAAKRNGITIRTADIKNWDAEIAIVKDIWEKGWHKNWGFTPWHDPEFKEMARSIKKMMNPELTYIAEINGKAVGFCFPIPDINFALQRIEGKLFPTGVFKLLAAKKKAKILRVAAFGVLPEYQSKGIDGLMITKLNDDGLRTNMDIGEFSWILESNYPLRNLLEKWGCVHYKIHRVYDKTL